MTDGAAIELYWLPLGAGGSALVRISGRLFERLAARRGRRPRKQLFHSALGVRLGDQRWTIEMAPVWSCAEPDRGVVAEGPVGTRLLGLSSWFRYEVRCWPEGAIPDAVFAVGGPVDVPTDRLRCQRLLELVRAVPTPVWGRDELDTGEMWNSNSVVSWLLAASGHSLAGIRPPIGGRAPGWEAGRRLAPMRTVYEARV